MVGALQNTARQSGSDTCPCQTCSVSKSLSPVHSKHHCGKKRAPKFRPPFSHTRNARSFLLSHLPPSRELLRCIRFAILTTWFDVLSRKKRVFELILSSTSRTPSVEESGPLRIQPTERLTRRASYNQHSLESRILAEEFPELNRSNLLHLFECH